MKNSERILKNYDIKFYAKNNYFAISKKGENNFKAIAPSTNLRLYFMFGNEFNKATIQELITKRKAIKVTGYNFYKMMLEEKKFNESLEKYKKYKKIIELQGA